MFLLPSLHFNLPQAKPIENNINNKHEKTEENDTANKVNEVRLLDMYFRNTIFLFFPVHL